VAKSWAIIQTGLNVKNAIKGNEKNKLDNQAVAANATHGSTMILEYASPAM